MSISIQGPAAAQLATLESLTTQAGKSAGAGATSLLDATAPPNPASALIDVSGPTLGGVSGGLATSASAADAAVAAGSTIEGLLAQMRHDAVGASDPSLDDDRRAALDSGFKASLGQIQTAIAAAGVGGVNLLDGSIDGAANVLGAALSGVNLSLGGPLIGVGPGANLSDPATAGVIARQLGDAIDKVGQAVDQIAAQGDAIAGHLSVVVQAGLSLSPRVAGAVSGGLDQDGARLAALQVQQQLSLGSGGLASQAPNAILSLFQTG